MPENLRLYPPKIVNVDTFATFVHQLNERLDQVTKRIDREQNAPVLRGNLDGKNKRLTNIGKAQSRDDAMPLGQLKEALDDLLTDQTTSAGEDLAQAAGTGGRRRGRRTSRRRVATEDDITAAIEAAAAVNPPPKVANASAVGSVTTRFALEDHTHQGVNLDEAQTITGSKTFDLDPGAPFAVSAGSAVVPNLDADKVDGFHASATAGTANVATVSNVGGTLDFNARVQAALNSGATLSTRRRLNFIEGTGATIIIADDVGNEEIDITISATGTGGTVTSVAGGVGLTATPSDPITTTGTLDLDINSLTSESTLDGGDLIPFVDVSAAGAPGPVAQRKMTLGDLATALSGAFAHTLLSALHTDTVTNTVTRGSLVVGNATPAWDEFVLGAANEVLVVNGAGADPDWATLVNANIAAGAAIDATKIADGSVTSTEFQFINTLTSNAQTQLDGKQPLNSNLTAFAAESATGFVVLRLAGDTAIRALTAGVGIAISNTGGFAGDPVFDLDINALTTNATLASGDLFPYLDVSVGSTPAAQRKATLGNLATFLSTGGVIDHGGLGGLADDDHTQYLLLAGRAGGQVAAGGTATSDHLDLKPHSAAYGATNTGRVRLLERLLIQPSSMTVTGGNNTAINVGGGATYTASDGSLCQALEYNPTILFQAGPAFGLMPRVFVGQPSFTLDATMTITPAQLFYAAPIYSAATGRTITVADGAGSFQDAPQFNRAGTGVYDAAAVYNSYTSQCSVGSGATLVTRRGIRFVDGSGAGAITNQIALFIPNLTKGGTLNASLVSEGSLVQLRHAGAGVFGASAAPTNASVGLEVQSTTRALLVSRMTTAQRDTLTGVAVADGMILYNTTLATLQYRKAGAWVSI